MPNTEHIQDITVEELTALFDRYGMMVEINEGKITGIKVHRRELDK